MNPSLPASRRTDAQPHLSSNSSSSKITELTKKIFYQNLVRATPFPAFFMGSSFLIAAASEEFSSKTLPLIFLFGALIGFTGGAIIALGDAQRGVDYRRG